MGEDGGKKVSGRKRHVLVDTLGLLLKVVVHPASLPNLHDRLGAKLVLGARARLATPPPHLGGSGLCRLPVRCASGHASTWASSWKWSTPGALWRNLQRYFPVLLDDMGFQPGFHVLPRRWVVERTFAWLGRSRRLSRDSSACPPAVRRFSMSPASACSFTA